MRRSPGQTVQVSGPAVEVVAALDDWLGAADPEALIITTSGSTGRPKRVRLPRSAVLASVAASGRRTGGSVGGGPWLLALPAAYVAGVQVICRSLVAGHAPVLADPGAPLSRTPGADRVHAVSLVPTQLHRLLDDPEETVWLAGLHTVLLGGGPLDPALRARVEAAGVRVVATYGSAETAGGCVYDGLPLDGVEVALDDDGRIRMGGPTLFEGYDGDPVLTAETLVDGWFRTADAGRLTSEGRLEVLGRLDDVVLSGGLNVPGPAVAARLREHPDVTAVEVLGVADREWGRRLVAFVVGPLSLAEARDWVAAVHPRAWAPRQVVAVDAVPELANGKPDRVTLARLAEEAAQ